MSNFLIWKTVRLCSFQICAITKSLQHESHPRLRALQRTNVIAIQVRMTVVARHTKYWIFVWPEPGRCSVSAAAQFGAFQKRIWRPRVSRSDVTAVEEIRISARSILNFTRWRGLTFTRLIKSPEFISTYFNKLYLCRFTQDRLCWVAYFVWNFNVSGRTSVRNVRKDLVYLDEHQFPY